MESHIPIFHTALKCLANGPNSEVKQNDECCFSSRKCIKYLENANHGSCVHKETSMCLFYCTFTWFPYNRVSTVLTYLVTVFSIRSRLKISFLNYSAQNCT